MQFSAKYSKVIFQEYYRLLNKEEVEWSIRWNIKTKDWSLKNIRFKAEMRSTWVKWQKGI